MEEKKKDILEKGAILQRDGQTYAIAAHIPGGIITPGQLRTIADAAERYGVSLLKMDSGQRMIIVGIKEEDLDNIWKDLGILPGAAIGLCVHFVKFCPGSGFCRFGLQDSIILGKELDKMYHGFPMPSKFKIGISGCSFSCAESWVKDLGFIGTKIGWKVMAGGTAGIKPRIADMLTQVNSDGEALRLTEKILKYCNANLQKKKRLAVHIEEIGIDEFKKALEIQEQTRK